MQIYGWGRYPRIETESIISPVTIADLQRQLKQHNFTGIVRGMGRSYGDSSLASHIIHTRYLNHLSAFDIQTGVLRCSAGVSLAELLPLIIPRGWFLPVTPGTKFVTVGGAIASDVHGKNHHGDGCFSEHVNWFSLMLGNGEIVTCSRQQHPELFHATCGGMGLTGIILEAEFKLKAIKSSYIRQTTIKAENLQEALELFIEHETATYSVAWIDCLAHGKQLGRSLLTLGEHAADENLSVLASKQLPIPVDMPNFVLNNYSIQLFNELYYQRVRQKQNTAEIYYDNYFYPLDRLLNWNRLYGKNGLTQYQFVIPKTAGIEGMTKILQRISAAKRGSFLAVLKTFGAANENYLSFPLEGYTLALDFKITPGLFDLLDELDHMVLDFGGRLYLSKDARMSEQTFKQSYPRWEEFQQVRSQYGADKIFHSVQSERLGLN